MTALVSDHAWFECQSLKLLALVTIPFQIMHLLDKLATNGGNHINTPALGLAGVPHTVPSATLHWVDEASLGEPHLTINTPSKSTNTASQFRNELNPEHNSAC